MDKCIFLLLVILCSNADGVKVRAIRRRLIKYPLVSSKESIPVPPLTESAQNVPLNEASKLFEYVHKDPYKLHNPHTYSNVMQHRVVLENSDPTLNRLSYAKTYVDNNGIHYNLYKPNNYDDNVVHHNIAIGNEDPTLLTISDKNGILYKLYNTNTYANNVRQHKITMGNAPHILRTKATGSDSLQFGQAKLDQYSTVHKDLLNDDQTNDSLDKIKASPTVINAKHLFATEVTGSDVLQLGEAKSGQHEYNVEENSPEKIKKLGHYSVNQTDAGSAYKYLSNEHQTNDYLDQIKPSSTHTKNAPHTFEIKAAGSDSLQLGEVKLYQHEYNVEENSGENIIEQAHSAEDRADTNSAYKYLSSDDQINDYQHQIQLTSSHINNDPHIFDTKLAGSDVTQLNEAKPDQDEYDVEDKSPDKIKDVVHNSVDQADTDSAYKDLSIEDLNNDSLDQIKPSSIHIKNSPHLFETKVAGPESLVLSEAKSNHHENNVEYDTPEKVKVLVSYSVDQADTNSAYKDLTNNDQTNDPLDQIKLRSSYDNSKVNQDELNEIIFRKDYKHVHKISENDKQNNVPVTLLPTLLPREPASKTVVNTENNEASAENVKKAITYVDNKYNLFPPLSPKLYPVDETKTDWQNEISGINKEYFNNRTKEDDTPIRVPERDNNSVDDDGSKYSEDQQGESDRTTSEENGDVGLQSQNDSITPDNGKFTADLDKFVSISDSEIKSVKEISDPIDLVSENQLNLATDVPLKSVAQVDNVATQTNVAPILLVARDNTTSPDANKEPSVDKDKTGNEVPFYLYRIGKNIYVYRKEDQNFPRKQASSNLPQTITTEQGSLMTVTTDKKPNVCLHCKTLLKVLSQHPDIMAQYDLLSDATDNENNGNVPTVENSRNYFKYIGIKEPTHVQYYQAVNHNIVPLNIENKPFDISGYSQTLSSNKVTHGKLDSATPKPQSNVVEAKPTLNLVESKTQLNPQYSILTPLVDKTKLQLDGTHLYASKPSKNHELQQSNVPELLLMSKTAHDPEASTTSIPSFEEPHATDVVSNISQIHDVIKIPKETSRTETTLVTAWDVPSNAKSKVFPAINAPKMIFKPHIEHWTTPYTLIKPASHTSGSHVLKSEKANRDYFVAARPSAMGEDLLNSRTPILLATDRDINTRRNELVTRSTVENSSVALETEHKPKQFEVSTLFEVTETTKTIPQDTADMISATNDLLVTEKKIKTIELQPSIELDESKIPTPNYSVERQYSEEPDDTKSKTTTAGSYFPSKPSDDLKIPVVVMYDSRAAEPLPIFEEPNTSKNFTSITNQTFISMDWRRATEESKVPSVHTSVPDSMPTQLMPSIEPKISSHWNKPKAFPVSEELDISSNEEKEPKDFFTLEELHTSKTPSTHISGPTDSTDIPRIENSFPFIKTGSPDWNEPGQFSEKPVPLKIPGAPTNPGWTSVADESRPSRKPDALTVKTTIGDDQDDIPERWQSTRHSNSDDESMLLFEGITQVERNSIIQMINVLIPDLLKLHNSKCYEDADERLFIRLKTAIGSVLEEYCDTS